MKLLDFFIDVAVRTNDAVKKLDKLEKKADRSKRSLSKLGKQATRTGDQMIAAGRGMRNFASGSLKIVSAAAAGIATLSFNAASSFLELESKAQQTFGNNTKSVRKFVDNLAKDVGRANSELLGFASDFGVLLTKSIDDQGLAANITEQLTAATLDLASFFEKDDAVASNAIRSGLAGESEPLRQFGIFMNDAAIKAKLLENGIVATNGAYTEQEKILGRSLFILDNLGKAEGDAIRTAESTANQVKKARAAFINLQIAIGTKLLPVLTPLVVKAGDLLQRLADAPPIVQKMVAVFVLFAAAASPVIFALGALFSGVGFLLRPLGTLIRLIGIAGSVSGGLSAAFAGIRAVIGTLLGPLATGVRLLAALAFTPVGIALLAIAAVGLLIYRNWDKIRPVLQPLIDKFQEIWTSVQPAIAAIREAFDELKASPEMQALFAFLGDFAGFIGGFFVDAIVFAVKAWVDSILGIIAAFEWMRDAAGAAATWVIDTFNSLMAFFSGLPARFMQFGLAIMAGLRDGFAQGGQWVKDELGALVDFLPDWVKKRLGIASPSKLFAGFGGNIAEGLANGIKNGESMAMKAAMGLADAVASPQFAMASVPGTTAGLSTRNGAGATTNNISNKMGGVTVVVKTDNPKEVVRVVKREFGRRSDNLARPN